MPDDTLLLIDGHALVYRAFFAMPALTNSRGELNNAAYGFTSMLLKVLNDERPSHAVAAFDPHGPTFRHEQDATYKAQRPPMPDDLSLQFPWAREVCEVLGIPVVEVLGFEADDVIGTLSLQAEASGMRTVILTGDLDALQLVSAKTVVLAPRRGISDTVTYDVAKVHERYGFDPPRMIDYKALCGDSSDNIPGVPGIGDKTAMSLVQQYGDAEGVLAAISTMKPGRLRTSLEEHVDQVRHSHEMATICRDVDIRLDPDAAQRGALDTDAVREAFERLGFRSLLARLPQSQLPTAAALDLIPPAGDPREGSIPSAQLSVDVDVVRESGSAAVMVERLSEAGDFALHSVADGLAVVGLALATLDGDSVFYVPLGETLDAATPDAVDQLGRLLADPGVGKHAYDLKREVVLWQRRGVVLAGLRDDLLLAAYVVNQRTRVATLPTLARVLCHVEVPEDDALIGSGRQRRQLVEIEIEEVAEHAGAMTAVMGRVETQLKRQMAEGSAADIYRQLELPLVPILAAMEVAGVLVDRDMLANLSDELGVRLSELEAEVAGLVGHGFNLGSTQQVAVVLYDELGLAVGRKTKSGRSTDADTLDALREQHAVVPLLLEWRQLSKLKSTYVDALPSLCGRDQRIHTSFNQAVAATGRLSSTDPNLQNIPVRTEWGRRIRRAFVAAPGMQLVAADYSQIELRVLAHMSDEDDLVAAFQRGEDIHQRTAAEVYGVAPDMVTADMRRIAKVVNFGVLYGLSDFGLTRDTGMDRADAAAFITKYFASFPKITAYLEQIREHAREHGWVATLLGRRRYLPDIRAANRQLRSSAERMAVNMPMQGTAADIMKLAMIRADAALQKADIGARMLLQVHDELVVEVPDAAVDDVVVLLRDAMAGAADLRVPLVVDFKLGQNWADMAKLTTTASV